MDQRLILVTLLIRLGVAAAISSVLVRARRFRVLLFREERTLGEKIEIVLIVGMPIALGVLVRGWVHNFYAADIAFEGAILMGVIGGRLGRRRRGLLVALPRCARASGCACRCTCSPASLRRPAAPYRSRARGHLVVLAAVRPQHLSLDPPQHSEIVHRLADVVLLPDPRAGVRAHPAAPIFPRRLFALDSTNCWVKLAIYAGRVMAVAIALKVLNNVRIEMKLEQQERLLLQARMEALQSQINPHFLFNTLNSVSSLVRADPDSARVMIVKLGNILRRLLRKGDALCRCAKRSSFIDDYLDIEVVRFGHENCRW